MHICEEKRVGRTIHVKMKKITNERKASKEVRWKKRCGEHELKRERNRKGKMVNERTLSV